MWHWMTFYLCATLSSCLPASVLARCSVLCPRDCLLRQRKMRASINNYWFAPGWFAQSSSIQPAAGGDRLIELLALMYLRNMSSADSRCCCRTCCRHLISASDWLTVDQRLTCQSNHHLATREHVNPLRPSMWSRLFHLPSNIRVFRNTSVSMLPSNCTGFQWSKASDLPQFCSMEHS